MGNVIRTQVDVDDGKSDRSGLSMDLDKVQRFPAARYKMADSSGSINSMDDFSKGGSFALLR